MQNNLFFSPLVTPPVMPINLEQPAILDFSESFFSTILEEISQNNDKKEFLNKESSCESITPILEPLTQEAKSIDEHLLDDLLMVVSALQQEPNRTTFPTLKPSSPLHKLLANENIREEFAQVKNISDLVDLSQKYNLGLEKISITKESFQGIQEKFPTLEKTNFFKELQATFDAFEKEVKEPKVASTNMVAQLTKYAKSESTPMPSMLKELISKTLNNEAPTITTPQDIEETPITPKELAKPSHSHNEPKTITLGSIISKLAQNSHPKKSDNVATAPIIMEEKPQVAQEVSEITMLVDEIIEELPKSSKTEKTNEDLAPDEDTIKLHKKVVQVDDSNSQSLEEDGSSMEIRVDSKTTTTKAEFMATRPTLSKESINQFANDLREKIEAYKPPIMKVELSLSPKTLGDVDVTLLTRGNNLHVNISSNTTAISLFAQNQAEVKNALINMGFTNLEMNFSDQKEKERPNQNTKNSHKQENNSDDEMALLEIVLPQYV